MSKPSPEPPPMTDEESLKLSLKTISAKYTLQNSSIINQIVKHVSDKFCGISLMEHRTDPSLILFVCDMIEQAFVEAKSKKVDKKEMALKIMTTLCPTLSPEEKKAIDGIIEFLHSSGSIRSVEQEVIELAKPIFRRIASGFKKLLLG